MEKNKVQLTIKVKSPDPVFLKVSPYQPISAAAQLFYELAQNPLETGVKPHQRILIKD